MLSVASKIFFSVVAKKLYNFLLSNNYIDTVVQKGGVPGVPGCPDHTGVMTKLIRVSREGRGDLAVARSFQCLLLDSLQAGRDWTGETPRTPEVERPNPGLYSKFS